VSTGGFKYITTKKMRIFHQLTLGGGWWTNLSPPELTMQAWVSAATMEINHYESISYVWHAAIKTCLSN
jgi:hypothetical protein